jgi:hypothetical protein
MYFCNGLNIDNYQVKWGVIGFSTPIIQLVTGVQFSYTHANLDWEYNDEKNIDYPESPYFSRVDAGIRFGCRV